MAARVVSLALAIGLAVAGCGKKDKTKASDNAPGAAKSVATAQAAARADATSPEVTALLQAVPGDAFAVGFVDMHRRVWDMFTGGVIVPLPAARKQKLDAELKQLLKEAIGLDPSGVVAAVAFVREGAGMPNGAVLIKSVTGDLQGAKAAGGLSLRVLDPDKGIVAAKHKDVLAVGPEAGVRAAFDTMDGKRDNLAKANGAFAKWVTAEAKGASVAAAVWVPAVKSPMLSAQVKQVGLERALVSLSRTKVKVLAVGDGAKLGDMANMFKAGMTRELAKLEDMRQQMSGAPAIARAGLALQYHYAHGFSEAFTPKTTPKGLSLEVPLRMDDGAMVFAMIGVSAAVAVPAFMKYTRKAKTSEAAVMVRKMYDGARTRYMEDGKFPAPIGPTPALGTCCAQGGRCQPDGKQWAQATWVSLGFSVDDPHYYSYEFKTQGKGFTVLAFGDLDCDGVYSTFSMDGLVDPSGAISSSPGVRRINEHE